LYLDAADLADAPTMDAIVERIQGYALPADFALLIEGPVGSLDGDFFDVTRESPADRLVVDRLGDMTRRLGVKAVNVHVISPSDDLARLTLECRDALLGRAVPFLRHFANVIRDAGAIPTVENMPPVLRMRRGGFYFTPIGMASTDLRWVVEQVPELAVLPDTSHGGLYLNARRGGTAAADAADQSWLSPLLDYVRQLPEEATDVLGYCQALAPHIASAQISNVSGVLGEGLPYGEGELDLDPTIRWLDQTAQYVITEPLEPDQDDARHMRDMLRRMRAALA
jgi:hypothetical protein